MSEHDETPSPREHLRAAALGAALALAAALLAWYSQARAAENTIYRVLEVPAAMVAAQPVVVAEPPAWQSGDPAAVVVVAGPDRGRLRTRLIADILAQRVLVAEVTVAADLDDAARVAADIRATLAELQADSAPGQVVLFGFGWDASGAAVGRVMAAMQLEGREPVFAAGASLGAGCSTATPFWDEEGEWRLLAILAGEAEWMDDTTPPEADLTEVALACGLALLPTRKAPLPAGPPLPMRAAR